MQYQDENFLKLKAIFLAYILLELLQWKFPLYFICNHFSNSQWRGGSRWGSIPDVKYSVGEFPRSFIEHKVIHQIAIPV